MSGGHPSRRAECDWGPEGLRTFAPYCDRLVVIDVLSFSTTVDIACGRGALVYPAGEDPATAHRLAQERGAALAGPRGQARYSLSPASVEQIAADTRLILPSRNGAALCLAAQQTGRPVFTAGLRNAAATAHYLARFGGGLAVLPAAEQRAGGSPRFALEDWLGAGALLMHWPGPLSSEAEAAVASFRAAIPRLHSILLDCASGRELVERGFAADVELAAELDCSQVVAELRGGCFVNAAAPPGAGDPRG